MTDRIALQINEKTGAPIVRSISGLEDIDVGPDRYVHLVYEELRNSGYVRISARNHHPYRSIQAHFYVMHEQNGRFIPSTAIRTVKTRLNPSATTPVHYEEADRRPRLFLFNAAFEDEPANGFVSASHLTTSPSCCEIPTGGCPVTDHEEEVP